MKPSIEWTSKQLDEALWRIVGAETQMWTDIAARLQVFYGYIPDELLALAKQMSQRRIEAHAVPVLPPKDAA